MPNTPDNKPTIIDMALEKLEEVEKEQIGYQTLNGQIREVTSLVNANIANISIYKEIIHRSFEKACFNGFEFIGIVPDQEKLQASIKLLIINRLDSNITPARVMVSMDLYPAGQIKPNENQLLGSLDYTLGDKLLIKHNKADKISKTPKTKNDKNEQRYSVSLTPSDPRFEQNLLDIEVVINTAKKMLQGLSL